MSGSLFTQENNSQSQSARSGSLFSQEKVTEGNKNKGQLLIPGNKSTAMPSLFGGQNYQQALQTYKSRFSEEELK